MKNVFISSEASGKGTADVDRRPETKIFVEYRESTRQRQTDYKGATLQV